MKIKFDCMFFCGDKPCIYKLTCEKCPHYQSVKKRILIIKLGAIGDVLRTTPLLRKFKKDNPHCQISWVVDKSGREILENNHFIDRILELDFVTLIRCQVEEYDLAICLDKEPSATALCMLAKAKKKLGYGMNKYGSVFSLNKEADYSFNLGLDNKLKFRKNKKTYPELIFEASGLKYNNEEYVFNLTQEEIKFGEDFLKRLKIKKQDMLIGLNTGCGDVFATKGWRESGFIDLAKKLVREKGVKVFLLGGPCERGRNLRIKQKVKEIIDTGCHNTLREFACLINSCQVVVSADTIAMHLGIALKKQVVALFGPTCPQEIELYGRVEKIISDFECAPCYKQKCDGHECMNNITAEMVFEAVKKQMRIIQKLKLKNR